MKVKFANSATKHYVAKQEILRLDPFNKEIRNLVIPDTVVP